jgi:hypothetical protein
MVILKWAYIVMSSAASILASILVAVFVFAVFGSSYGIWAFLGAVVLFVIGVMNAVDGVLAEGFGRKLFSWWPDIRDDSPIPIKLLHALIIWLVIGVVVFLALEFPDSLPGAQ